MKIGKNQRLLL